MDAKEASTVECLAFLRSASEAMKSARSARGRSTLPSDIQDQILTLSKQVAAMVTTVWDALGDSQDCAFPIKNNNDDGGTAKPAK